MFSEFRSPGGRGSLFGRKKEFELWAYYPYGMWTCQDGRQVMFNRFYEPIWQRCSGATLSTAANPAEWVEDIVKQEWFYTNDIKDRARLARAAEALSAWGISSPAEKPSSVDLSSAEKLPPKAELMHMGLSVSRASKMMTPLHTLPAFIVREFDSANPWGWREIKHMFKTKEKQDAFLACRVAEIKKQRQHHAPSENDKWVLSKGEWVSVADVAMVYSVDMRALVDRLRHRQPLEQAILELQNGMARNDTDGVIIKRYD